jgi:pyrimidine-nucleoside phosphorylase
MMVATVKLNGRGIRAVLSDMNQPLGTAIGNAIELRETIDILHGNGLADFLEQCLVIANNIIFFGEKEESIETALELSQKVIDDGSAWSKFEELVEAQGGDITYINQPK